MQCGSEDRLEVDHKDPTQKITHRIWSWAEHRRVKELAKCQVLCYNCHLEKSKIDLSNMDHMSISGENHGNNKYSEQQVKEIVALRTLGLRTNRIAEILNVNRHLVGDVLAGRSWGHLTGISKG